MGLKTWVVDGINDNCPTLSKYAFVFTSCLHGEFSCHDGSCIAIGMLIF